jgi:polygalacturonase
MQIQGMVLQGVPSEQRIFGKPEYGLRPQFINPVRCKNVLLEGFTIAQPGPFWTIQFVYCENIIARELILHTKGGPNNDGINLDSSRYALVEHCLLDTGDDAICLKSGINEDGRRVGRPTENIVVRNICSQNGIWGGISIGSEMSGDVRNVLIHDCNFVGTRSGIYIKSNSSRGGVVERIWYRNITFKDIHGTAIFIHTDYTAWMMNKDGKAPPIFRDIEISNITCDGAAVAAFVNSKPEQPIERLVIKNLFVKAEKGMTFNWVNDLKLIN